MQKRIQIFGVPYWLGVYQEAPHEWFATGEVRGHPIEVADKSERGAIEKWRLQAEAVVSGAEAKAGLDLKRTNGARTPRPCQRR